MYTGSAHQLWEQFRAALWVIFWSALVTYILMKLIGLILRGARYSDDILEIGDMAIHDEQAFHDDDAFPEALPADVLVMSGSYGMANLDAGSAASQPDSLPPPRPDS
jgi:hypothetical protein